MPTRGLSLLDLVDFFHVTLQFPVCKAQEWGESRDALDVQIGSKVFIFYSKITCPLRLGCPLLPSRFTLVPSFVPPFVYFCYTASLEQRRPS